MPPIANIKHVVIYKNLNSEMKKSFLYKDICTVCFRLWKTFEEQGDVSPNEMGIT